MWSRPAYPSSRPRSRGFTLLEVMTVVAILAVIAATAIPVYQKYIKRTRTTEAVMQIRRIYDSSVTYFAVDRSDAAGVLIWHQFPSSVAMTPATPAGTFPQRTPVEVWNSFATWNALNFTVADPHLYAYQFDSSGTDNAAAFTISAFGDLDGDTVYSTFVRFGSVDQMMVGGSSLFAAREIE